MKNNEIVNKKKNNFRRLNFNDNENQDFSECLIDLEKKEKKLNKENLNIQNIINLKDSIMKLGILYILFKIIFFLYRNFYSLINTTDIPKYIIDLKPLEYDLPYNEILKHFKENNKFLFEMTNEEKELNDKLKAFNYVCFNETITDNINSNNVQKKFQEDPLKLNNKEEVNSSKITNYENDLYSSKKIY
jgi:hypothetical protein